MYGVAYLNMSRTRALTYVYTHAHPWACDLEFSSWSKDMWRGLKSIVIVMVSAVYLMRIPRPWDRPKSPPKTLYLLAPYKLVTEYVTFNLFWVQ